MTTRAPFLKNRYSGYHHRQVPQEDTELTHVGPERRVANMRRFWQPICYVDELKDLPVAVKILGEELVVFAMAAARSACWSATARTVAPRSNSAWLVPRGYVAATTVGCSTWTAQSLRRRASRRPARSRTGSATVLSGARGPRLSSATWGRRNRCRRFPPTTVSIGRATGSFPARSISIRATGCRSSKTRWTRPHRVPAHDRQRRGVHRRIRRVAGIGVCRNPGDHLHRDQAGRRKHLGADGRKCVAQSAAGRAGLGNRAGGASLQRADDEPLDRAARRYQDDADRIAPRQEPRVSSRRIGGLTAA